MFIKKSKNAKMRSRPFKSTVVPPTIQDSWSQSTLRKWHSETNMILTPPESVPYYYGHITRENAELILFDRGCMDGMYLLRASHSRDADYVLSLCYEKQVVHYRIIRDADDLYHVSGMDHDKYIGPVELIQNIPEFVGYLNIPCLKPLNVFMPGVNCSVSEDRLREALSKKATEWGVQESEFNTMLGNKESDIWNLVLKTLHEFEPWFHGRISREEAEARLMQSGSKNGKFLVRERDECSFTLSLSHESQIKHYKIEVLSTGEVGIQDGPRFDSLISLVSHYSVFSDGLWCQLQQPCMSRENLNADDGVQLQRGEGDGDASSKPLYPLLPTHDLLENPTKPQSSPEAISLKPVKEKETPAATNKVSNKKGSPVWFINQVAKLSKDKVSQEPVLPEAAKPKKLKLPKGKKAGKLTSLDISAPVVARPAPPPPVSNNADHVLPHVPSSLAFSTVGSSNGMITKKSSDRKELPLPPLEKPLHLPVLSASTQVPLIVADNQFELKSELSSPNDVANFRKPLPAPRQKKMPLLPTELSSPCAPPSPFLPVTPHTPLSPKSCQDETVFTYPSSEDFVSKGKPADVENSNCVQKKLAKAYPWMNSNSGMSHVIAELKSCAVSDPGVDSDTSGKTLADKSLKPTDVPQYEEIDPEFETNGSEVTSSDSNVTNGCPVEGSLLTPEVENVKWDSNSDEPSSSTNHFQRKPPWTKEESELHFKTLRRYRKGPTAIDRKNLFLQEKLGLGNFGDVVKAIFKSGDVEVPCAVKTLRKESISSGKDDILREARIMTKLDHPHIVRLLGVSEGDPFYLIMELAPLGPLNVYVKRNQSVPTQDILLLLYQVALGMEYLESNQFVHRDLAARNVLLVNESFAKISDFGMSRALGLHCDYYRVEPRAKLPLKWYAPECIYYFRFSCKSDVWSFGITMWEALSNGERPYQGLTGHEILKMFNTNQRLSCPERCQEDVYNMMWKCWQFRPEDRPTFAELRIILKEHLNI